MIQVFSTRADPPHAYRFGEYRNPLAFDPIEFAISNDGHNWTSAFDVPELTGVYCYRAPDPQPANPTDTYKKVGIADGQQLMSTSYDTRELKMQIACINAEDESDGFLGFNALQRFLVSRTPYWICFANWPGRMYYVKAKLATPTYYGDNWTCEVTFTDLFGLSRSIGTTGDWGEHIYAQGNNELQDNPGYTFTTNQFTVHNLSDVLIDPERRGHPFKLTLDGTSNGNLKITNRTTGDVLSRQQGFSGQFVMDGINPTLNGKGDFLQTNAGILTLQIGANDFVIENFSGTVKFDFAMWWLS